MAPGKVTRYEWDQRVPLVRMVERDSEGGAITNKVNYTDDVLDRRIERQVNADSDVSAGDVG